MNARKLKTVSLLFPLLICVFSFAPTNVRAQPSTKQARKAITGTAGFKLTEGSVRVKTISATSGGAAEATAEIRTVFRFEANKEGIWRVAEVRSGQDTWESIDLIATALKASVATGECTAPDPLFKGRAISDPSVKRARCLLGSLLGVEVPSDAVRIQEVVPMPIPLSTEPSATVVAWLKVDARLVNDKGWRVSELRTGTRDWVRLAPLLAVVNEEKQKLARKELELIATALEKFRKDRGSYVVSDQQAVAIDYLTPRYLVQVIRVDPWHQPYKYLGERDHFTLRSTGPDGKADTPDDLVVGGQ